MIKPTKAVVSYNGIEVSLSIEDNNLDEVLQQLEQVLRGVGYLFDGHLEIVKDE